MGPLLMLGVIAVQNSDSLLEERHRRFPGSSGMPTPLPESTLPPVITTSTDEGGDEGSGDIDITTRTSMAEDLCVDLYAGGCHRGWLPCCPGGSGEMGGATCGEGDCDPNRKAGETCHGHFMKTFCRRQCGLCSDAEGCPWFEATSGEDGVLLCVDGTRCSSEADLGWNCCQNHGGRAACPRNIPFMCSDPLQCNHDYCCGSRSWCEASGGGVRTCNGLADTRTDHFIPTSTSTSTSTSPPLTSTRDSCSLCTRAEGPVCDLETGEEFLNLCFALCGGHADRKTGTCMSTLVTTSALTITMTTTPTTTAATCHFLGYGHHLREQEGYCAPDTEKRSVRCCSDTEKEGWARRFCEPGGKQTWSESDGPGFGGCNDAETWQGAFKLCDSLGARLCTLNELEQKCTQGTGCGMDKKLVWSSSTLIPSTSTPASTSTPEASGAPPPITRSTNTSTTTITTTVSTTSTTSPVIATPVPSSMLPPVVSTSTPTITCTDDLTWRSVQDRDCVWVAVNTTRRCDKESTDGTSATTACPVTCGTCRELPLFPSSSPSVPTPTQVPGTATPISPLSSTLTSTFQTTPTSTVPTTPTTTLITTPTSTSTTSPTSSSTNTPTSTVLTTPTTTLITTPTSTSTTSPTSSSTNTPTSTVPTTPTSTLVTTPTTTTAYACPPSLYCGPGISGNDAASTVMCPAGQYLVSCSASNSEWSYGIEPSPTSCTVYAAFDEFKVHAVAKCAEDLYTGTLVVEGTSKTGARCPRGKLALRCYCLSPWGECGSEMLSFAPEMSGLGCSGVVTTKLSGLYALCVNGPGTSPTSSRTTTPSPTVSTSPLPTITTLATTIPSTTVAITAPTSHNTTSVTTSIIRTTTTSSSASNETTTLSTTASEPLSWNTSTAIYGNIAPEDGFMNGEFVRRQVERTATKDSMKMTGGIIPGPYGGLIEVAVGTSTKSVVYPAARGRPARIKAQLVTSTVYYDDPALRVAVQVLDEHGNVPRGLGRPVVVRAQRLSASTEPAREASCTSPQYAGTLCVISVPLPSIWFDGIGREKNEVAAVAFFDDEPDVAVAMDRITIVGTNSDRSSSWGNIWAQLPVRPVFPAETFEVPVFANFPRYLQTFTIDFEVSAGLVLSGFELAREGGWSGATANADGRATLAFIRDPDELPKEEQSASDGGASELLATMRVLVSAGTQAQKLGVMVRWNDTSDVLDATVIPAYPSVIYSRDNTSVSGWGEVYIERDTPRALFVSLDRAELVNTAVITSLPVETAITAIAVHATRTVFRRLPSTDLRCASQDPEAFAATCSIVQLTGTETRGSGGMVPAGMLSVEHIETGLKASCSVRVWYPAIPLSVNPVRSMLRRIKGVNIVDGGSCTPRFQQTSLEIRATFSIPEWVDGDEFLPFMNYTSFSADISALLQSSAVTINESDNKTVVAAVKATNGRLVVHGVAHGTAHLTIRNSNGVILGKSVVAVVDDKTSAIAIVGLDVTVITDFTVKVDTSVPVASINPYVPVEVELQMALGTLSMEGASADVIVTAIFDDGSRMELTATDGLLIASGNTAVITVENALAGPSVDTARVKVPYMATSGVGDLVKASWIAADEGCMHHKTIATGVGFIAVELPKAEAVRVVLHGFERIGGGLPVLVQRDSEAAAAGLSTSGFVEVNLIYPGALEVDATHDNRTRFELLSGSDLAVVTRGGTISTLPSEIAARIGRGVESEIAVQISFDHENVTTTVAIQIAGFVSLRVHATPWPSYSVSDEVFITNLSRIFGTAPPLYQEASLVTTMLLTNGVEIIVADQNLSFSVVGSSGTSMIDAKVDATRGFSDAILTVTKPDVYNVTVAFAGTVSPSLTIMVADAPVFATSLDLVRVVGLGGKMNSLSTLRSGASGDLVGYVMARVTLSDSRKYDQAMAPGGVATLPGLLSFSSNVPTATTVDANTGAVQLLSNHPTPVIITVSAVTGLDSFTTKEEAVFCNLDPGTIGDVDIGAEVGAPLVPRVVGDSFEVPFHVNTGDANIGAFDIYIQFDPHVLQVSSPKVDVAFHADAAALSSGIIDAVVDGGQLHVSGSLDSPRVRGSRVSLITVRFVAINEGESELGGTVVLIADAGLPPKDIGRTRGRQFVSGNTTQIVRKSARRDARSERKVGCTSPEHGDTNADCVFDVNDVRFITQYLAYRGIDFSGKDGRFIQATIEGSSHSAAALDADLNGEINGKDASFLNKVNLGIFGLIDEVEVIPVTSSVVATGPDRCMLQVNARLYGKGEVSLEPERVRVYFDLAHPSKNFTQAVLASATTIGTKMVIDKGNSGGIIEAILDKSDTKSGDLYRASIGAAFGTEFTAVGVSVILAVIQPNGHDVRTKLISGLEKPPFAFEERLVAKWISDRDDVKTSIESAGTNGYNPLLSFTNELSSLECNQLSISCGSLVESVPATLTSEAECSVRTSSRSSSPSDSSTFTTSEARNISVAPTPSVVINTATTSSLSAPRSPSTPMSSSGTLSMAIISDALRTITSSSVATTMLLTTAVSTTTASSDAVIHLTTTIDTTAITTLLTSSTSSSAQIVTTTTASIIRTTAPASVPDAISSTAGSNTTDANDSTGRTSPPITNIKSDSTTPAVMTSTSVAGTTIVVEDIITEASSNSALIVVLVLLIVGILGHAAYRRLKSKREANTTSAFDAGVIEMTRVVHPKDAYLRTNQGTRRRADRVELDTRADELEYDTFDAWNEDPAQTHVKSIDVAVVPGVTVSQNQIFEAENEDDTYLDVTGAGPDDWSVAESELMFSQKNVTNDRKAATPRNILTTTHVSKSKRETDSEVWKRLNTFTPQTVTAADNFTFMTGKSSEITTNGDEPLPALVLRQSESEEDGSTVV